MATLLPNGKQNYENSAGAPLVGGKVYTYDAGTTNPRPTYQDAAGTIPNTNPVILDARGEATIFWSGVYKIVLKDASDNTIWTVDNAADPTVYSALLDATLRSDLASTADASKGAGMLGFNQVLNYVVNTIGYKLKRVAYSTQNTDREIRLQGGALRRESGAWGFLNSSGHLPLGFTGASEVDAYTLRVTFDGDNTNVGTLLAVIDMELAPYGIVGGCSCNANYADFKFYTRVVADLQANNTISVAPWLASYVTLNASGTYSTIINHPPRALNVDPIGATLINRVQGASRDFAIQWGTNTATITALGELGMLVTRTGAGVFTVSSQTVQGTVTAAWNAGTATLTITHPDCSIYSMPVKFEDSTAYRAVVTNVTATTVSIQFYNAAGALVAVDDANMRVWIGRTNAKFNTPMPAGFSAQLDLGMLAVPLAAIQNISLNNFWLIGAMLK